MLFRRYFPIRLKTLVDFIRVVTKEQSSSVTVEPLIKYKGVDTTSLGHVGDVEYSLKFTAETVSGRPIVYQQQVASRFGSEYDFTRQQQQLICALRGLLTAANYLETIKEQLPHIRSELMTSRGRFTQGDYDRMRADCERYKVTPLPITGNKGVT